MRLVLDLETASTVDLTQSGAHAYSEHPSTVITCLCFAIGGLPVETWTSGPPPSSFLSAIAGGATVVAHNYQFEFNVYHAKLLRQGWPRIPLERWSCTMARSLVAGYPAGLEAVSKAAHLAIPKDASARPLMLRMARPRTPEPLTWWHETSPEHFERLIAYCRTDVEAERLLDQMLPELSPRERQIFEIDHRLNQIGLRVDVDLVHRLHSLAAQARAELTALLSEVTMGAVTSPHQVARLSTWLGGQGCVMENLRRNTVQVRLNDVSLTGPPREALQARLDASRSSVAKLGTILSARSRDGRVKGTFQYYGANHTGRWAGRRLQPQNLYRGSIKNIPAAIEIINAAGTVDDLAQLFDDSAMGVIASCLRATIQAPPEHKLVVVDFASIEARVLAWLADERAALDIFARGQDIYTETARQVGSTVRQLGKIIVLALGFGMGPQRFRETAAAWGIDLEENYCVDLVRLWREANPSIVNFWWDCSRAMERATEGSPGFVSRVGCVHFIRRRDAILVRLPAGRHLIYHHPKLEWNEERRRDQFTYMGTFSGTWAKLRAWPGKLVENITQAVARDVLVEAMLDLQQHRLKLVGCVHDELIAEAPASSAERVYDLMQAAMQKTPLWAPGLPLAAAGFIAQRYRK
jgi:DNA polymerase